MRAATRNQTPIARAEYRAPDWLVPEAHLDFEIGEARARVRARIHAVRSGEHRAPLRLDGEGLKLISITADGKPVAHKRDPHGLTVRLASPDAWLEIVTELTIGAEQSGLFALDGALCTQCEPHGFRRIAYFPDRPDVRARFTVRISADAARFPVLLSNGNRVGEGALEGGRHWAEFDDPWPKPAYLFSLAAGAFAARRETFVTRSGREVALAIWSRPDSLESSAHAMAALQAAMGWDERVFGREYDLDRFDIVALHGFAFGAVEAKALNLFDAALLLADPAQATDTELAAVTALVGHEYFHNWTGNRVTIRDWFELGLKEGLTVFRDQQFLADLGATAAKRIQDVRALRAAQFTQDAGAQAHPVRPDAVRAIGDLYSATVYAKGAEIVRMLRVLLGPDAFRSGLDRFFAEHDGTGATLDALCEAMGAPEGFGRWFAHRGTLRLRATHSYVEGKLTLTLAQDADPPLVVPVSVALLGDGGMLAERMLVLSEAEQRFTFEGLAERPRLSIHRGFSAPAILETDREVADLAWLAAHDDDGFARWDAMQALMHATLLSQVEPGSLIEAMRTTLGESDAGLIAELTRLPTPAAMAERLAEADPAELVARWHALRRIIGQALAPEWRAVQAHPGETPGARALRSVALDYLLAGGAADAGGLALAQMRDGPSMTERLGALKALADSDAPERAAGLAEFHGRWRESPALLDAWFAAQAASARADTIETAPKLLAHPDFTLAHPTRLSAIIGSFSGNLGAFHHPSGRGYRFLADVVLAADRLNPQASVGLIRPLTRWRGIEPGRAARMRGEAERIRATPGISSPLLELLAVTLS